MKPTDIDNLIITEMESLTNMSTAEDVKEIIRNTCRIIFIRGQRIQMEEDYRNVRTLCTTPSQREEIRDAKSIPNT